jgi:hypothetical protein
MRAQLLDEIKQVLGNAISPNLTSKSKGCDLYEAYVFSLVVRAALRSGAQVRYENKDLSPATTFTFRTSPGEIAAGNYSHAVLSFSRKPDLEAHVGIYVSGVSKIPHEADVCVLLRDEALFCRGSHLRVFPRYSSVEVTAECKFYESSGIGVALGRGFMGLSKEFASRQNFFVMSREAMRVKALLAHHKQHWATSIVPGSPLTLNRLIGNFETVFENFKAKR